MWLIRRSCVLVMHEDRIVVVIPDSAVEIEAKIATGVRITIDCDQKGGYVLATSDPGDSFAEVVNSAQAEWRRHVSAVDALADTNDSWKHKPAHLKFETDHRFLL